MGEDYFKGEMSFTLHQYIISTWVITGHFNLVDIVKVISAEFLYCKVIIFYFHNLFVRYKSLILFPYLVQLSSVTQSCWILCDPMNRSMPGPPVHHRLPEFTQTHAYRVGDAIQPSHPLSSPSPSAPNPSQHQGLFQWVNSSHEVAKVLEFQLQHQSFQWIPGLISFRMDWLDLLAGKGN